VISACLDPLEQPARRDQLGPRELQVPQGPRDCRDPQGQSDPLVLSERPDFRGLPDPQDRQGFQDLPVRLVLPDLRDLLAPQEPQVAQGPLERLDLLVQSVLPDQWGLLVLQASMELLALPGLQVLTAYGSPRCIGFRQTRPAHYFASDRFRWEWHLMDPTFG
jgi:hypothetical protein